MKETTQVSSTTIGPKTNQKQIEVRGARPTHTPFLDPPKPATPTMPPPHATKKKVLQRNLSSTSAPHMLSPTTVYWEIGERNSEQTCRNAAYSDDPSEASSGRPRSRTVSDSR